MFDKDGFRIIRRMALFRIPSGEYSVGKMRIESGMMTIKKCMAMICRSILFGCELTANHCHAQLFLDIFFYLLNS